MYVKHDDGQPDKAAARFMAKSTEKGGKSQQIRHVFYLISNFYTI